MQVSCCLMCFLWGIWWATGSWTRWDFGLIQQVLLFLPNSVFWSCSLLSKAKWAGHMAQIILSSLVWGGQQFYPTLQHWCSYAIVHCTMGCALHCTMGCALHPVVVTDASSRQGNIAWSFIVVAYALESLIGLGPQLMGWKCFQTWCSCCCTTSYRW